MLTILSGRTVTENEINPYKIIKWSAIAALMVGTFSPSVGAYSLISKYIVVAASLIVLTQAAVMRQYIWIPLFLVVACVFNPVFPILFSDYFSGVARTLAALLFFFSLELLKPKPKISITQLAHRVPKRGSL